MVSWYGEVTPSSHQKRHVFPYLHCRRFVFSGKQKNILKIVLFKFLHVLIWIVVFYQTIVKKSSDSYDLVRTARMGGYGLCVLGPTLHCWFNFMSRLLPRQDFITTFKKMAMGNIIYGPVMMVTFFSLNALLQGKLPSMYSYWLVISIS